MNLFKGLFQKVSSFFNQKKSSPDETKLNVGTDDNPTFFDLSPYVAKATNAARGFFGVEPSGPSLKFEATPSQIKTITAGGERTPELGTKPEDLVAEFFRAPARFAARTTLGGRETFTPTTQAEKFVFGPEAFRGFTGAGETISETVGLKDKLPEKALPFIGVAGGLLESFPGFGKSSEPFEIIAKSKNADEIFKVLKGLVKGSEPEIKALSESLVDVSKADEVKDILTTVTKSGKERKFIDTVRQSENTAPEVAKDIKGNYIPITNKETLAEAQKFIDTNFDEAVRIAKGPEPATARSNAIAQELIQRFQNEGNFEQAIELVETTAKKATTQGQAIQALSMYNRLTPEGVLRYTQRLIDRANSERGGLQKISLEAEKARLLRNQARKAGALPDGREKIVETAKLVEMIHQQIPPTLLEKISTMQTMAQLLNPKTFIRNIVGNAGFSALENVKDIPAAALDSAMSLLTGKRTKTLPSVVVQAKGAKIGLVEGVQDALQGINTSYIPTQFELPKTQVFSGPVGRNLERLLNIELRAPDRAMYKAAYDGSLYQQMKAAGVTEPTEAMKEIAHYDGLYRTFQDDNATTYIFSKIKNALNVGREFGVGDIVLKYPKTPANLLNRGIAYSPAGFVNALFEAAKPLIGHSFDQKKFVEAFSRAFVGTTGLVGAGSLMRSLGIITGRRNEDTDVDTLERLTGLGQYRINISALKRFVLSGFDPESAKIQEGDHLISYDWFQPQAIPLSIGANLREGKGVQGQVGTVLQSIANGLNTLAEQPLISGLKRVMETRDFSESIQQVLRDVPSSFVPTFLNQIRQLIDNTQRNTYDPDVIQYALNLAKNKIPGFSGTLQPRVGPFGADMEVYQGESNNPFNVFFNPAFTSNYKPTEEAQLVLDLFEQTGETTQFPRIVGRTQKINGENVKLNPIQISSLQRYVGRVTKELFASFAEDQNFQSLPPDEKVQYLQNVLTDIGTAGKVVVLGNRPKRMSNRARQIIEHYR